ncbi:hypothetical protein EGT07_23765 [Herbaspirillum sp. HC18]|nr:hypothetical protein EGT07_23765 [Herbaspirillum sp. HC18]
MKTIFRSVLIAAVLAHAGANAQSVTSDATAPVAKANTESTQWKAAGSPSLNKLRMNVVMAFPAEVGTVRDVALYLLEPAGYKLASSFNPATSQILSRPLLPHLSDKSLMAIEDALLLVSGDDTRLVVDHANKLVTFERM